MKNSSFFGCGGHISLNANSLGGILFHDDNQFTDNEIVILMGGFARVATKEKLLFSIAEKLSKSSFIFDWHGLGLSAGNFGDVTVKRLKDDLKRIVGVLFAEGFSKFHLVGHSLGACVIALFENELSGCFDIGKKVFISAALDQSLLLRYWFAKEKGNEFDIYKWQDNCEENSSSFDGSREKRKTDYAKCWEFEDDFQAYIRERKSFKGIDFNPDYWLSESTMRYQYYLSCYDDFIGVFDENALFICGQNDNSVPPESFSFGILNAITLEADHYMMGKEEEVAERVYDFIGK